MDRLPKILLGAILILGILWLEYRLVTSHHERKIAKLERENVELKRARDQLYSRIDTLTIEIEAIDDSLTVLASRRDSIQVLLHTQYQVVDKWRTQPDLSFYGTDAVLRARLDSLFDARLRAD